MLEEEYGEESKSCDLPFNPPYNRRDTATSKRPAKPAVAMSVRITGTAPELEDVLVADAAALVAAALEESKVVEAAAVELAAADEVAAEVAFKVPQTSASAQSA